MSLLDEAIEKGRRKRRLVALGASLGVLVLLIVYGTWLLFTKGYSFTVLPDDAAKTEQFAVQSGIGFFIDNKYYAVGSTGDVLVSAEKYQPKIVEVSRTSPSNIEVELQPKPARVTLTTASETSNVSWYVDGERRSVSKVFNTELAPGNYTLMAEHPAFESAALKIDATIDADIKEQLTLIPITGTISLQSQPSGAQVSVAGQPVGITPVTLKKNGGDYEVVVTHTGYEPLTDRIAITSRNKAPTRNYRLQPLQASINVVTEPSGGALLVNGRPATSPLSVDADKAHEIRYEKSGYQKQSQTISLKPGETRSLNFKLAAATGTVRFTASLESEVYIDGNKRGVTPLNLDLQTLPSEVEFRKQGFRTVKQEFQPVRGETTQVQAEILREFDARRKEGKPLFIAGLGIDMNRVSPRAFTMGSPVNEPDRSRNEHQVRVAFSRDVWISKHEITEAQFAAFTGAGSKTNLPVTNITWQQAALYTNWLSEQEGLSPFYQIQNGTVVGANKGSRGYRLPTEAEWEFIAKINRRSESTMYVWGSQDRVRENQGNFADESLKGQQTFTLNGYNDGFAGKAPVGSFNAERGGFFDLDGNVREWVHDRYTLSPPNLDNVYTNYLGAQTGNSHVVKGASYKSGRLKDIRTSLRDDGDEAADDIGFRIARYQDSQEPQQ